MQDYPNLVIAIGASAGGLKAITEILEKLPKSFQATILIANHRDPRSPNVMSNIIRHRTCMTVTDAKDDLPIECTTIYLGGPNERVEVEGENNGRQANLDVATMNSQGARMQRIDDLFRSVATVAGHNSVGIVLSGMLWDGVEGLQAIKTAGGKCIVQDPEEAQFKSMPENALELVDADFVGTCSDIADYLIELVSGKRCQ